MLLAAAEKLNRSFPKAQFIVPLAQSVSPDKFSSLFQSRGIKIFVASDITYETLAYSQVAAIASGTATIEAAILGCPMVIIYRGARLLALEYKLRKKAIKFIGMPNIVLDRLACPELIQEDASPEKISEWMALLIEDSNKRQKC